MARPVGASVEEHRAQAMLAKAGSQTTLGLVQFIGRAEESAVLVAVGIAEHHFNRAIAAAQAALRQGHGQHRIEDGGRVAQIFDGFKERHDPKVQLFGPKAGMAGQKINGQHILGRAGHGQDKGANRFGVV